MSDVSGPDAAASVRPMTHAEFETWREDSVTSYAGDLAAANGQPVETALTKARRQFAELLPDGVDTDRAWLFKVVDAAGADVGVLWIGLHPDRPGVAYVYDIAIDEPHRGRGLGRAAMLAAERVVTEAGMTEIGLNVFGFNDRARGLYDSLGYRVVATQMTKSLAASAPPQGSA
jgi:ribosomal protein S18 acetylase RimI-like enzyme